MSFAFGVDVLLQDQKLLTELKSKRVALVAHPASLTSDFKHSMDALFGAGVKLVAGFGPQHGIYGEKQYNMQETPDLIDRKWKIPVYSLYGEVRRPTREMMNSADVFLLDLQDVGTRIYTFLTTLFYMMEEASHSGAVKEIWVLDRPNPAGRPFEGSLLIKGATSFVGCAEDLPMRHGLTLGEFAIYFKKRFALACGLKVIQMKEYKPDTAPLHGWVERSWVNPSPNAATLAMARAYPGTVMLEGTTLSEGRGTTHPLELVGAPDIDAEKIIKKMFELKAEWCAGCKLRSFYFEPTFYKHKEKCAVECKSTSMTLITTII